jgi:MFS family permease
VSAVEPGTVREQRAVAVRGWAVAVSVYLAAVFHRTSLGVAGWQAQERFGISPAQLSVFVLVQLGVYAAMQVPTGVLADRYGPRRLLIVASSTMAVAQLLFAVAPTYPAALLARALLGCGDALTFVSVLRFASHRFSARQYPVVVAVTGMLGLLGNIAATLPLSVLLHRVGWFATFAGAGALSALTGALVWSALPDRTVGPTLPRSLPGLRDPMIRVLRRVGAAWSTPATRLGFWVHFSCMSTTTMFAVLWGVPYLVANGFESSTASAVLFASVLVAVAASPLVGGFIARWPASRVPLAIGCCVATIAGWAVLVAGIGGHPLIVVVACAAAVGGPASAIGFSLARDYNEPGIVGTATGVVNVGGFLAAIVASLVVGVALSLTGAAGASAYRVAFAAALSVQLIGTLQTLRCWLQVRAHQLRKQETGLPVPVPLVRHRFDYAAQ